MSLWEHGLPEELFEVRKTEEGKQVWGEQAVVGKFVQVLEKAGPGNGYLSEK